MCDYSLFSIRNRLAEEGDELVLRRFETGTLGFAALSDVLEQETARKAKPETSWAAFKAWVNEWLLGRRASCSCVVCIPPGARLLLSELPRKTQISLRVAAYETVVFTELSGHSYSYRDALVLPNGTRVLLQDLPEGIHALVLSVSSEPSTSPVHEALRVA